MLKRRQCVAESGDVCSDKAQSKYGRTEEDATYNEPGCQPGVLIYARLMPVSFAPGPAAMGLWEAESKPVAGSRM